MHSAHYGCVQTCRTNPSDFDEGLSVFPRDVRVSHEWCRACLCQTTDVEAQHQHSRVRESHEDRDQSLHGPLELLADASISQSLPGWYRCVPFGHWVADIA